jgi:hypothetical protein
MTCLLTASGQSWHSRGAVPAKHFGHRRVIIQLLDGIDFGGSIRPSLESLLPHRRQLFGDRGSSRGRGCRVKFRDRRRDLYSPVPARD